MVHSNWRAMLASVVPFSLRGRRRKRSLALERLEDRTLLIAYVVNTLADNTNTDGFISLREALVAAASNGEFGDAPAGSNSETDTVTFAPGLTGTITLSGTTLSISDTILTGPGAEVITISGNNSSRVFFVFGQATIEGVGITGGGQDELGGGILVDGFGSGLTLRNAWVHGNSALISGGGLHVFQGVVNIYDSTISGNSSNSYGGGVTNDLGTLRLINSTVSGNSTLGEGGGIAYVSAGSTELTNSTVTGNRANADNSGGESGGGVSSVSVTATLNNSIVAGNFVGNATVANDIAGTVTGSNNLIGDADSAGGLTDGTSGNIVGVNGVGVRNITTVLNTTLTSGAVPVHMLLGNSPAVDAGDNALAIDPFNNPLEFDQRGTPFARIIHGTVDIGSVEVFFNDVIGYDPATGQWRTGVSNGDVFTNTPGPQWSSVAGFDTFTGDFTGDGFTDLAGRTDAGVWFVSVNNGDGTYAAATQWGTWTADATAGWSHVTVADFNDDGCADIVGLDNQRRFFVSLSTITSFFTSQWGSLGTGYVAHTVGDFNGDGRADVANLHQSGAWFVSEANAGGSAFVIDGYGSIDSHANRNWRNLMTGDFNGDNVDDILIQDQLGNWFIGRGTTASDGRFTVQYANRWNPTAYVDFKIGDFNGDGRDDLAGRLSTHQWWVNRTLANGRMDARFWANSGTPVTTTVGDFNGDGIADLATLRDSTKIWFVLLGRPTNTFLADGFGNWTGFGTGPLSSGDVA